jgi:DNA-directed RNA polymerase
MGDQQYEDLMLPLQAEAIRSKKPHHFGTIARSSRAQHATWAVWPMRLSPGGQEARRGNGLPEGLSWRAGPRGEAGALGEPCGLPCVNRYHEVKTEACSALAAQRAGHGCTVAPATQRRSRRRNASRQFLPTSCIRSTRRICFSLWARARTRGSLTLLTVHDSFGCLPAHADRFNQIIREQFVKMYQEHDALTSCTSDSKGRSDGSKSLATAAASRERHAGPQSRQTGEVCLCLISHTKGTNTMNNSTDNFERIAQDAGARGSGEERS